MPPRNISVQSVSLNELHVQPNGAGYDIRIEYNITFSDSTGQARQHERTVSAGQIKTALDNVFADIRTRVGNVEGITVT